MVRRNIRLGSFEEALSFIKVTEQLDAKIRLVDEAGRIDGKSLMGILSMKLGKKIIIEINGSELSESNAVEALDIYMVDSKDSVGAAANPI